MTGIDLNGRKLRESEKKIVFVLLMAYVNVYDKFRNCPKNVGWTLFFVMDICFRAHSSGTTDGDKKFPCLESNVKLKVVSILFHFIQVVSSHVGLIGSPKRFFLI